MPPSAARLPTVMPASCSHHAAAPWFLPLEIAAGPPCLTIAAAPAPQVSPKVSGLDNVVREVLAVQARNPGGPVLEVSLCGRCAPAELAAVLPGQPGCWPGAHLPPAAAPGAWSIFRRS